MQVDEVLAQECGHSSGEVSAPTIQGTTGVALEKREAGRSGAGVRSGEQVVVLLVRKTYQGK